MEKLLLDLIDPLSVDNFYTHCDHCDRWIEFNRIEGNLYRKITEDNCEIIHDTQEIVEGTWN